MKKTISIVLSILISASVYAGNGKVKIEGSTTVLPIAQKTAEVFMENNSSADLSVRGGGSGVGISALIDGVCDIANASRSMKQSEVDKAVSMGREPKSHIIAMDGLCVIVHKDNPLTALTKAQIKDIFTGKINNWSEVGGESTSIVVVSRDSASGTFEAFGELALDKEKVRSDALMQASNQAVASAIAENSSAIGYVGLGYLKEGVKALQIEGVTPSKETVLSGKYGLSRPLFMYTNGTPTGMVKEYIDFIKSPEGQKIAEEEGFVPLQ